MKNAKFCAALLVATLVLPACTGTKQVAQTTPVNYYPACYQPISTLRDAENHATKSAVVGGASGALLGGLLGGLASGNATGAIIGAGTGMVAGAAIGYAKGKQDTIKDVRSRYASYVGDIKSELGTLDSTMMAAKAAQACYERSFNELVEQYKAKTISAGEYKQRFNEIREGLRETAAYLGQSYATASEKEKQFRAALENEASTAGKPVPTPRPRAVATTQKSKATPRQDSAKKSTAVTPVPQPKSAPARDAQPLAGLDESTLDTMSTGTAEYGVAKEETQNHKVAIEQQLLKMDDMNASLTTI